MHKVVVAVVAAVLAGLLSVAAHGLLHSVNRGRQKRTMADMRSLATALEARATDVKSYSIGASPRSRVSASFEKFGALRHVPIDELERALVPIYIKKLPRNDGWGRPFDVRIGAYDSRGRAQMYAMRSYGSDGRADGDTYASGVITHFREDLVMSDGNFVRHPGDT